MSKATTIRHGLILLAASLWVLVTPWATKKAIKRVDWDTEPSTDQHGMGLTIRGDLHPDDAWRGTLDDRLPGGTYEPTVAKMLEEKGRDATAFYWIGRRNRAHGMRRKYARPSTLEAYNERFEPDENGHVYGIRSDGTWYRERRIGPFKRVTGWRIYRALIKGKSGEFEYLAVPTATIKKA